jgi:hypothetical protein
VSGNGFIARPPFPAAQPDQVVIEIDENVFWPEAPAPA